MKDLGQTISLRKDDQGNVLSNPYENFDEFGRIE